jgi:hypothetical protein
VDNTSPVVRTGLLSNPVYGVLSSYGFGTTAFLNQGWYDNVLAVDGESGHRLGWRHRSVPF